MSSSLAQLILKIHRYLAEKERSVFGRKSRICLNSTQTMRSRSEAMRIGTTSLAEHNSTNYRDKMRTILSLLPPGGSVENLPISLRPKSSFKNTYARLIPTEPSPTVTRNFGTPSSSRCVHPFQNRALSTREGARLQGFPDRYLFTGGKCSKNLQIGNAVPPFLVP